MLVDAAIREQALNPDHSFIVQAPAGSGKTELLTQRFLRLLSTVPAPEQLVALTFTRKAASEMQERITHALQTASSAPVSAVPAHQHTTYRYAQAVLAHSEAHGWDLLNTPTRLRITTIDSLCQLLANAIPLHEKHTPYARVTDTPEIHYLNAARACFEYLLNTDGLHATLETLLEHLDNRQDVLIHLFVEQLYARDQWLRVVYQAKLQDKAAYEYALRCIEQHEILRFTQSIPLHCREPLQTLTQQLARLMTRACTDCNYQSLSNWHTWEALSLAHAHSLGALLLTRQQTLRKAFDHHVGFKRDVCQTTHEYQQLKTDSKALLSELAATPGVLEALLRINLLPQPVYPETQWKVLQALLTTLPILAAHLQVLFQAHNQVDFTEVAYQALQALGEQDAPTDLALYLDHTLQHVLIDEFQDTSLQQFELLTRLVEGFTPDSGKTVFIVGDPMQSIYRFRGAEVGLFLRAQRHGIGPVSLTALQLQCNFRASTPLVEWINQRFAGIFPKEDDLESGAIRLHAATAVKPALDDTPVVHALEYTCAEQQAEAIVQLVRTQAERSMALLVRSRRQLRPIVRALRAHHIPYQGVDIDWIATLPHVRDAWSLTQALLMPGNRLAWFSVLRSPWCGVGLADLHALAQINPRQSIHAALQALDAHQALFSNDGYLRLRYVGRVLCTALNNRHQQPLVDWLLSTLQQLHSDAIIDAQAEQDLEQYWQLLERFEQDGQLPDLPRIEQALNQLYSKAQTPAKLHIMTIHKAKGLEFDCVILPSLSARLTQPSQPLLRWLTLPTATTEPLVLLSPLHAADRAPNPLYEYLGALDKAKDQYEQQRLLYVACTRARQCVYLLDYSSTTRTNTFRSLLHAESFTSLTDTRVAPTMHDTPSLPTLQALPLDYYRHPPTVPDVITPHHTAFTQTDSFARLLGVVTHEVLEWMGNTHPATRAELPAAFIENALQQHGVDPARYTEAMRQINAWLDPLFNTPRGRWLMQARAFERNEYALLVSTGHEVHTQIIDRLFYADGVCWIIDFKTGREAATAHAHHVAQLNAYAATYTPHTSHPVHCGLYYLHTAHWMEWVPETGSRVHAPEPV